MRKGMSLFLAAVTMAATVAGAGVCEGTCGWQRAAFPGRKSK